tara:strand:- start:1158 stop:2150 length:993 start_codon:yes stop_codon:yes gene_type:complete
MAFELNKNIKADVGRPTQSSAPPGSGSNFTGSVGSLGYGDFFEGTTLSGGDWQTYFDDYDPAAQEMATRHAGMDTRELQDQWNLQSQQLGQSWQLGQQQLGQNLTQARGQLGQGYRQNISNLKGGWEEQQAGMGSQAARGFQQADLMGETMQRKGRGLMHGEQRQRMAESEIAGAYKKSFGLGQSAYERATEGAAGQYQQGLSTAQLGFEQQTARGQLNYDQSMDTGQLGLQQGIQNIGQGLESTIFGLQQDWMQGTRGTLNTLLGMDIWSSQNSGDHRSNPPINDSSWQPPSEAEGSSYEFNGDEWEFQNGQWVNTSLLGEQSDQDYGV